MVTHQILADLKIIKGKKVRYWIFKWTLGAFPLMYFKVAHLSQWTQATHTYIQLRIKQTLASWNSKRVTKEDFHEKHWGALTIFYWCITCVTPSHRKEIGLLALQGRLKFKRLTLAVGNWLQLLLDRGYACPEDSLNNSLKTDIDFIFIHLSGYQCKHFKDNIQIITRYVVIFNYFSLHWLAHNKDSAISKKKWKTNKSIWHVTFAY